LKIEYPSTWVCFFKPAHWLLKRDSTTPTNLVSQKSLFFALSVASKRNFGPQTTKTFRLHANLRAPPAGNQEAAK
jgi:hypothetical protein